MATEADQSTGYVRKGFIPHWVLFHPNLSPSSVRVYGAILAHIDKHREAFPKHATIGKRCKLSAERTRVCIKQLEAVGALVVRPRFSNGQQTSNLYIIGDHPFGLSPEESAVAYPEGLDDADYVAEREPFAKQIRDSKDAPKKTTAPKDSNTLAPTDSNTLAPLKTWDEVVSVELDSIEVNKDISPNAENDQSAEQPAMITEIPKPPDLFDEFWKIYPRKDGKAAARRAWPKAIKRAPANYIIERATIYRNLDSRREKYTPHASKWLNNDQWDDEMLSEDELLMRDVARLREAEARKYG